MVTPRISARFVGNRLNPAAHTFNGAALANAIYINGAFCSEVELSETKVLSAAASSCMALTRAAGMVLRMNDNNLGSQAHSISGSGGYVYERANRNPLYKSDSGYVTAVLSSNLTSPTLGAWTKLPLNSVGANVNAEWSTANANFTAAETGRYEFSGIMTVDPDAAGNEMGFRLFRSSGTPAELARLAFNHAGGATSHGVAFRSVTLFLNAGDVVHLEYWLTGATTFIVSTSVHSSLHIRRVS